MVNFEYCLVGVASKKNINVIVIDDEPAIREMIRYSLGRLDMNVIGAADAREALACVSRQRPDIILMDWMMPGTSGLELTRRLRRDPVTVDIPIIMLTAKITEDDKVAGLEAGADDYVIKPFSPRELVARINAVMRRSSATDEEGCISAGNLKIDTLSRKVTCKEEEIQLGPTEYRLLDFFMGNQGRSFSRSQILDHVWGTTVYLDERTVDVHIRRLRKALQPTGHQSFIQTVRGHGYRFLPPE